jgi:heptosyltransferase-2
MAVISCRHFTGYKPCGLNTDCTEFCPSKSIIDTRILIVHLGALGAVVRSTALLAPLRRRHPRAHLTWVTDAPADQLLRGHQGIDRVLTTKDSDMLILSALEFDVSYVIDKSLKAAGVLARTKSDLVRGFRADSRTGALLPATDAATELWQLGLDDRKKFFQNRKSEIQLVTEALELGPYRADDYHLPLDAGEVELRAQRRRLWSHKGRRKIIGLNTGCSDVMKAKKLSVQNHRDLIRRLQCLPDTQVVLLGGPEDRVRNEQISAGLKVILSDTESGLRDGLVSVAACDVVVTGDSLGMHMAIAMGVWTIAWFGPTCAHEIELFERGEKILTKAPCAPCWKRTCSKDLMCYDQVDLGEVEYAVLRGLEKCQQPPSMSLSKPPFLATSF